MSHTTIKLAQCWDDGVTDDIRVIEILRKYQAKASFNLNYALHQDQRHAGWKFRDIKEVYKLGKNELVTVYDGFLVANHTATHPHLTKLSIEEATQNVLDGKNALEQHFGYEVTGFAYPFGDYNAVVEEIIHETGHVYARTTVNVADVLPTDNPMAFHANCHFMASDFWDRFDHVVETGGVFYFWGHSYEMITEEHWDTFDQQIARLSATPNIEWVDLPSLFV